MLHELLYKYMYLKDHINAHNNPLRTAWCLRATFIGIMLQCNAVLNGLTIFQNFTTMYLSQLTVQCTFSLQWTLFVQWTLCAVESLSVVDSNRLTWQPPWTDWLTGQCPLQQTDSAARSKRLTRQPAPTDWLGSPLVQTHSAARYKRLTHSPAPAPTNWLTCQQFLQQTDWLASAPSDRLFPRSGLVPCSGISPRSWLVCRKRKGLHYSSVWIYN